MFMLTGVEDNVRVDPSQLGGPASLAVEEQLKKLYFDKVINEVGLVVSLYDITSIEGGDVQLGDGGVRFAVKFRLVVFRPFEGEVMLGRILRHGITLSLGFTEDVFIPVRYMQSPSMFDATQRSWFWKYDDDQLWLSKDDTIRFKVREIIFQEKDAKDSDEGAPPAPMLLIGDIDGDGLGCVTWWEDKDDDEDEEMQE